VDEDEGADETVVWPECWQVVELWLACATQWRRAGLAGMATGLDYPAVIGVAQILGTPMTPDLLEDLRAMESEALAAWAEERERDGE